jgi:hypothetical protein
VLNSRARGHVWPKIDCKHLSLLRKGITTCVWQIESRLIGDHAVRALTLERATFNVGSKPNGSRAIRAYIAGKLLIFFVSGPTAVTANEGTDIAGKLLIFCFCQRANSGHGQKTLDHGRATNLFTASQMAVAPQGL